MRKFLFAGLLTLAPVAAHANYNEVFLHCTLNTGKPVTAVFDTQYRSTGMVQYEGINYFGRTRASVNEISFTDLYRDGKSLANVVVRRDDLSIAVFDNGTLLGAGLCTVTSNERVARKF
jgi:hypothetical protein